MMEAGKEVKEGVCGDGEAGASGGAPLHNASKDEVKEHAGAMARKDSKVMKQ